MKINYLKVINFAGIYAGLGKTLLEIDFSNTSKKTILLKGGNGSGKTTLMSILHPFRETFDDRKNIILSDPDIAFRFDINDIVSGEESKKNLRKKKNVDGYKEIHYTHNNSEYIIKHIYGTEVKTFVIKDGVELNENGNVTSGTKVIESELLITKDYFTVGRIGDNVSNFIDLKTTDRKQYINKFVPDLDPYLNRFAIAKKNFDVINTKLKNLNMNLTKYPDIDDLYNNENIINSNIKLIKDEINNINNRKFEIQSQLKNNTDKLNDSIPDELKDIFNIDDTTAFINQLNLFKSKLTIADTELNSIYESSPKMRDYKEESINSKILELTNAINDYEKKKLVSETIIDSNNNVLSSARAKISEATINLDKIVEPDHNVISVELKQLKDIIKVEKQAIDNLDEINLSKNIKYENIQSIKFVIEEILSHIANVQNLETERTSYLMSKHSTIEGVISEINQQSESLNNLKEQIIELESKYKQILSKSDLIDALEKRPGLCTIDTCPFIATAVDYKKDYETLDELSEKIENMKSDYNSSMVTHKDDYDTITEFYDAINVFEAYKSREQTKNVLSLLEIDNIDSLNQVELEKILLDLKTLEKKFVSETNISDSEGKIDKLKLMLSDYEAKKKSVEDLKKVIAEKNSEIEDITTKNIELRESIDKNIFEISRREKIINNFKIVIEKRNEISKLMEEIELRSSIIDNISEFNQTSSNLHNDNHKLLTNLKENEINLNQNEKSLREITDKLAIVNNMKKEIEEVNLVLKTYRIIKDSLDPKKGIPLVFSRQFLGVIEESTNELLSLAYDDSFLIEMNVSNKEFIISVNKDDGTSLNDINEASQGEKALTNLSLSLSLVESTTLGYNILYLDEVDGVLSDNNRAKFVQMLESQLEYLNIEQCFIISHNKDMMSDEMALILLKDHNIDIEDVEFMGEKEIVYNIYD